MNVKQPLFDEILQNGIDVLGLSCTVTDLYDTRFNDFCTLYCEKLLFGTYITNVEQLKQPINMVTSAYASGAFCQVLINFMEEADESISFNKIFHIFATNPFHNDGKLIGILLNSDADKVKQRYCQCRDLIVEETLHLCRSQKISLKMDGKIEEVMTVLYALFVLGAHTKMLTAFIKQ